ncbi:hypothetical protein ACHQM5_020390 [Ranunculus cassubicifolius]
MHEFCNIVSACNLIEAPFIGNEMTWCNNRVGRERILAKLDRAFYNDARVSALPSWRYKVLPRLCSDHSPIFGQVTNIPKAINRPFKFFNVWSDHHTFLKTVSDSWHCPLSAAPILKVIKKLQRLKVVLKDWNTTTFGSVDAAVTTSYVDLAELQILADEDIENGDFNLSIIDKEVQVCKALSDRASLIRQKSRIRMEDEGDRNSSYFHSMLKIRQQSSLITELVDDNDVLLTSQAEIKDHLINYYTEKFSYEEAVQDVDLVNLVPTSLGDEDNLILTVIPTYAEIQATVMSMDPDSAPGPDGLQGFFYHKCWNIIKADVCDVVQSFFVQSTLHAGLNSNFITLIPKVKRPMRASDYRPICLSNFLLKIVSKLMHNRLKDLIARIVSEEQVGFISGRSVQSNIGLASELVNELWCQTAWRQRCY